MKVFGLLNQERTLARKEAGSKKKALQYLSESLSQSIDSHSQDQIFDHLVARERLGSTGLGAGVALPHSRLSGIDTPVGALITLTEPIDYDSPDNKPVDIIFCLVVPDTDNEEHLQLLAQLAELFMADNVCAQIRAATNAEEILNLIHHWQQHAAA